MAMGWGLSVLLIGYVLSIAFMFWFCVMADPSKSGVARFLSYELPTKFLNLVRRVLGQRGVDLAEAISERVLVLIYFAVECAGWTVVLWKCVPWCAESPYLSSYHQPMGFIVAFCCFGSWRLANKASPGIITKETIDLYDHYKYDNLLYLDGRICKTTGLRRIARSKFDRIMYQQNVARFDHFCGWIFNTVGEDNYRFFLLFVLVHILKCAYGTYMLVILFNGEVKDKRLYEVKFFDRATGAEFTATNWIVFQYLFHRHSWEAGLLMAMAVMGFALFCFLGYHFYITSVGMTTNEHYKWGQVRNWHKKEVKKYKESLKNEKSSVTTNEALEKPNPPTIPEADITCTGATSSGDNAALTSDESQNDKTAQRQSGVKDPGPMPQNIYNRGFVENWKEVLFPVSVQGEHLERPKPKAS